MLVLTRKLNEQLVFTDNRTGEEIARTIVVRVGPSQVRIGIDAPDHINISREGPTPETAVSDRVRRLSRRRERERCETASAT